MPIATVADRQKIIGSWFSSGFFGHSRAKSRTDLCDSFRSWAQPEPPKKFIERQNTDATKHLFSFHDNRLKSEADPLVRGTTGGFGRRRVQGKTRGEFDPQFLSWTPKKNTDSILPEEKLTSFDSSSKTSTSFIVEPTKAFVSLSTPSTYNKDFTHGLPDGDFSKKIRQETFQRFLSARKRRSIYLNVERPNNVASCLVWSRPNVERVPSSHQKETVIETIVPINQTSEKKNDFLQRINSPKFSRPITAASSATNRSLPIDVLVSKYM